MREKRTVRSAWYGRLLAGALAVGYLVLGVGVALGQAQEAAPPPAEAPKTEAPPAEPPATEAPKAEADAATAVAAADAPKAVPAEAPAAEAPKAGAAEGPRATPVGEGKIELHVKNEELANVLELLSRQYELNIVASKDAKGKLTADLYKVTIDQVLDAICRSTGLKWSREGNTVYIQTAAEVAAAKSDEARLVSEVFVLNYLAADEGQKLIAPALSTKATVAVNSAPEKGIPSGASGGTGGNSYAIQDTIVVRDFPEHIEQVRAILKKMDRRPRQVLVEATILKVTLTDTTSLGVDFNALAGINFRDLSTTALPVTNPKSVATTAATTAQANLAPWSHGYTTGFATQGTGLNIGVITNNVAFFISALENVTDTTVLSNPKVLALNKQRAEVIVGQRLGYMTTTTSTTTTVETVEFLDSGTQLVFRPFITEDGYIRLEVHPKVSRGEVTLLGTMALPRETTTEVTCNIMVKDGHTVVIGGLFDETASVARKQVPGLGNIPGLGWLFRGNEDATTRNEIIVLLTPHILDDEEASAALGQEVLDMSKRLCLGTREGFSFFTRERLTVGYMDEADQAWQRYEKTGLKEDLDKAWWNVFLTLNAAPTNLKALRMKDRVLSERKGDPVEPPNWTIWDSVRERLADMDAAKAAAAEEAPAATEAKPDAAKPAAKEEKRAN